MLRFLIGLIFLTTLSVANAKLGIGALAEIAKHGSLEFHKARTILKKHDDLNVIAVAGKADTRFILISPSQWDRSFRWDDFSETPAYGRMLCPGHPKNGTGKHLIIVQADATKETLAHEYGHYLQAKSDKKVCEVYNRIESSPQEGDKLFNQQLEYEVNRLLFENRDALALGPLTELSMLEKLAKQVQSIGPSQQKINPRYEWPDLSSEKVNALLGTAVSNFQKNTPLKGYGNFKNKLGESEIREGIALLTGQRVMASHLPLCTSVTNDFADLNKVITYAIKQWNELGKKVVGKNVFDRGCKNPRIEIVVDRMLGKVGDGVIKLGIVSFNNGRARVTLRLKEFQEYENLLSGIVQKRLFANSKNLDDLSGLKKRLEDFKHKKIVETSVSTVMHELGHALGLAHNFNDKEKSIMNYSTRIQFSDYDTEALRFVLTSKPPAQKFSPTLKPDKKYTFSH